MGAQLGQRALAMIYIGQRTQREMGNKGRQRAED